MFKRIAREALVACSLVGGACAALVGCSDPPEDRQSHERLGGTGTLQMALNGVGESGATYRLRNGVFEIGGPQSLEIRSEDHLGAFHVEQRLDTGEYEVNLRAGWTLERIDGDQAEPVDAVLISANPAEFSIARRGTTEVVFTFEVDGEIIEFGRGTLILKIDVKDRVAAAFIDPDIVPELDAVAAVEEGDPPRPVSAMYSEGGEVMSYVTRELIVTGITDAELEEVLQRVDGELVRTLVLQEGAPEFERHHLISIGEAFESDLEVLSTRFESSGFTMGFSDEDALATFSALVTEIGDFGVTATLNWTMTSAQVQDRLSLELPASAVTDSRYRENAFELPYMNLDSPQDIGVGEAWRALLANGITAEVGVLVLDGGFSRVDDFPANAEMYRGLWDVENPGSCGGADCDWHGTAVTMALAGTIDNDLGSAGSGGPFTKPYLVQAPADFFQFLVTAAGTISGLSDGNDIVNISAGFWIDQEICDTPFLHLACDLINGAFATIRSFDVLIVASAGNDGKNIGTDAFYAPCEAAGVFCVGGMQYDSPLIHSSSNYSYTGSVDLYAPYQVWVGPSPDGAGEEARLVSGTSFSAPFVAGIAAMVRAANPALGVDGVETILRDTAHRSTSYRNAPAWVNAYDAVSRALDGAVPPFVRIVRPVDGESRPRRNVYRNFLAELEFAPQSALIWTDNGVEIGTGTDFSVRGLDVGEHVITATAIANGFSHSDTVTIYLTNDAPTLEIQAPGNGETFESSQTIHLSGRSRDLNEDLYSLADSQVEWLVDSEPYAVGHVASIPPNTLPPGTHHISFVGDDGDGGTGSDGIVITIEASGENASPDIASLSPGDGSDLGYADEFIDGNWYLEVALAATVNDDQPLSDLTFTWETKYIDGSGTEVTEVLGTNQSMVTHLVAHCFATEHEVSLVVDDGENVVRAIQRLLVHLLC